MTAETPPSAKLGSPAENPRKTWVQTERKAHEAMVKLIRERPRAAMLLNCLIARMGHQNAVVVSQKVLAKLVGVGERTIKRAVKDLVERHFIQVVQLNGPGTVNAYVVNDRVAWQDRRGTMKKYSTFSANIVADVEDQPESTLSHESLVALPALYAGEEAVPAGEGEDPPSQAIMEGFEPIMHREEDGSLWEVDPETGERQRRIEDGGNNA